MHGKVVVVTGGFGVLGQSIAAEAAARGALVARIDIASAPVAPLAEGADFGGVDITDADAAAGVVAAIARRFGGIDVLVNVAGGFVWQTLQNGGPDVWARMFRLNVATAVTMTKAALPSLLVRPGARIVNIGAGAAAKAAAGMGAYAAAKSAVARLTESLAEELAGHDITVNAVLPSIIDTPTNRAEMPNADTSNWVKPEALAEIILFLASPAARAISGALIPVTRGGGRKEA
jgi:NAD(P)-dependent dehydrogenase (short-subunit alcohol dehydrogenase family)